VATIDPLGKITNTNYDLLNRPVSVEDANSNTSTTAYNAAGDVVSVTDPLLHTTSYGYDALHRVVTMTNALGNVTTYLYDGNRVTIVPSMPGIPLDRSAISEGLHTARRDHAIALRSHYGRQAHH
jgi:YD repeat-containing protein